MTDTPFDLSLEPSSPGSHAAKDGSIYTDRQAELHAVAVATMGSEFFVGISKYIQSYMLSDRFNQQVLKSCEELFASDIEISVASIRNYILSTGSSFDMIKWQKYIDYFDISGAHRAALRVRELYFRREMKHLADSLSFTCGDITESVFDIYENHRSDISALFEEVTLIKDDSVDIEEQLIKAAEAAMEGKAYLGASKTHLHCVDDAVYGLLPGDLLVVAGRPGMGKTTFLLSIAKNIAVAPPQGFKKKRVALFLYEADKARTISKMAMAMAGINSERVKGGRISHAELAEYRRAIQEIMSSEIIFFDNPDNKISDIRALASREHNLAPLSLIGVDYIQLVPTSKKNSLREQEVAEISRGLKKLGLKLKVPVIALSQLNRKVEDRPGCRPQISDLRESGAIEQDADVVMLLYCPEVYGILEFGNDGESTAGAMEVIYGKNREGSLKSRYARFDRPLGRIENSGSAQVMEDSNDSPF